MPDNEAGAFLNITPDVLNKLDSFDKKLENIQNHAKTAADALKSGFSSLNTSTSTLSLTIGALAAQIEKLATDGISIKNVGKSMDDTTKSTKDAASAVSTLTTNLSSSANIVNQFASSRPFSQWNIAEITTEINRLQESLKRDSLSGVELRGANEQAVVDRKKALEGLLKVKESSSASQATMYKKWAEQYNADAVNEGKAINRKIKAVADYQKWLASMQSQVNKLDQASVNAEIAAQGKLRKVRQESKEIISKGTQMGATNTAINDAVNRLQQAKKELANAVNKGVVGGDITGYTKGIQMQIENIGYLKRDIQSLIKEENKRSSESKKNSADVQASVNAEKKAKSDLIALEQKLNTSNIESAARGKAQYSKQLSDLQIAKRELNSTISTGVVNGDTKTFTATVSRQIQDVKTYASALRDSIKADNDRVSQAVKNRKAEDAELNKYTNKLIAINELVKKANASNTNGTNQSINKAVKDLENAKSKLEGAITKGVVNNDRSGYTQQIRSLTTALDTYKKQLIDVLQTESQLSHKAPTRGFSDLSSSIINRESIGDLKKEIADINKLLNQPNNGLTNQQSDVLKSKLKMYNEDLKLARMTESEKIKMQLQETANAKAESDKRTAQAKREADAKIRESQRAYKASADLAKQQNYQKNTTVQGALDFSKTAHTLQRQITAIEYLKKARLSLNTSTKEGQSNLLSINAAIEQHTNALQRAGAQSQSLGRSHRNLLNTAEQLKRQIALMFSVSQIEGYIRKVATVRGEFELNQVAIRAILNDRQKADEVYNKTLELALHSPFRASQLLSYTKQLAAYRIENDKLFDTTKRLADISAGLGVDMQRLILAYGQVKAAAFLKGTEVRQFTEAGVNMYSELQSYFKEVKGEAYTTAQIVDMISKRKVTFEDIEQIFIRMTNQGGLFYNMQEIQAQTLKGKIGILNDALDRMYNDIGKSSEGVLKGTVDMFGELIRNWKTVLNVVKTIAPIFTSMAITLWAKKVTGASSAVGIFARSIVMAKNAVLAFGKAFAVSWPLIAITAAIGIVTELISTVREYNKAIAESTTKYFEAKIRISTIQDESKSDIKKALDDLVKEMNNEGFEIEIKAGMSEKETEVEYDRLIKDYESFLNMKLIIDAKYAENKSKFLTDDIDEDSDDYASSAGEFIIQGEKLKTVMMQLATEEKGLSSEHKKTLEQLAKGPKEGEDVLSYTNRMREELTKMRPTLNKIFYKMSISSYEQVAKPIKDFYEKSKEYLSDQKELVAELESRFGSIDKYKTKAEKANLKVLIDKSGLNAFAKELAYKHYMLNVDINKKNTTKEINWTKKEIKDSLDGTKVNLNVELNENFLDGLFKELEAAQNYLSNVDKYRQLASGGRQGKIYWADLKRDSQFTDWYKNEWRKNNAAVKKGLIADTMEISDFTINSYIDAQEKYERAKLIAYNQEIRADKNKNKEASKNASRAERDIWEERISVLKEMQQKYNDINKYYGEDLSIVKVQKEFSEALSSVNMGAVLKTEDIIPTKKGLVASLTKVLDAMMKNGAAKKKIADLKKTIAQLKLEIDTKEAEQKLNDIKNQVDKLFDGLDLHKKLKDAGLSEKEVQALFPNIAKNLDDVAKGIESEFDKLRDKSGQLGVEEQKQYDEKIKKLNNDRIKEQRDLVAELTKAYKTQLSDQLQLDLWYYKEKSKINQANLTPALSDQFNKNLKSQYDKKSSENVWNAFKGSDTYLSMFDNLDYVSTQAVENMKAKLETLKDQMKSLDPSDLKEVMTFFNKLDDELSERKPLTGLISDLNKIKELKSHGRTEDYLVQSIAENDVKNAALQQEISDLNTIIGLKEEEIDINTINEDVLKRTTNLQQFSTHVLRTIMSLKQNEQQKNKNENEQANKDLEYYKKARKDLKELVATWDLIKSTGKKAMDSITPLLEEMGVESENASMQFFNMATGLADLVIQTILFQLQLKTATVEANSLGAALKSAAGPIGWILLALQGVSSILTFIIGAKDKKLQKKIENEQRIVKKLENAYDDLKESMDNAWSTAELDKYHNAAMRNIDDQIASYRAMIAAEEDKKKTDDDKISDWYKTLNDLEKKAKELNQSLVETMGGIGETNFKDAAQNFADAWVDAFNESEDGMVALQETFDELITNMVKKQAMMRVVQARMKSVFEAIDLAVSEQGQAGVQLTDTELANIQNLGKTALAGLNEDLLALMTTLGYTGTGSGSELSALTQSIQGLSENTAEELAALLNSIRFFVSQQTDDTSAIRTLLEARYALETTQESNNPMLAELKAQTGYLENLSDYIGSVFTYTPNSRGPGLRVFMQ